MKANLLKSGATKPESREKSQPIIHPVVIYPFAQPADYSDLEELYQLVARLDADKTQYARPLTVMDRKTFHAGQWNKQFTDFRANVVAKHSKILDAWCVDTCQMWYTGLGDAVEQGNPEDVYWLIPGDFNYCTQMGKEVLAKLTELPKSILAGPKDFTLGEIIVDINSSKQLIDTYGTYGLLYNWFPHEAQEMRKLTERPRSEFFAIRHSFLREALGQRWFAYEQTLVLLLQGIMGKKMLGRLLLGDISDLPQGRDSMASAIQQVERTERVLKLAWREQNQQRPGWLDQFQVLDAQSEQIRRAALVIFKNLMA